MAEKVKKFISIFVIFCLILPTAPLQSVYASPADGYEGGQNGDGRGICAYGVDLSEWQGSQVDFSEIREQGYSFVILRAGFADQEDACFERNYAAAREAGLNIGVYFYSYAGNAELARNEANALKGFLAGKILEYPVYYDIEEPNIHSSMEPEQITEIALAFMDSMASDGWLTGLYSCKSWLNHKIETDIVCADYECWMAMYLPDGSCDTYDKYDEYCGMWQYSSTGTVDGVPGNVDLDVAFKDYPAICAEYGFNGYLGMNHGQSEDTGIKMPEILVPGDLFRLSGQLVSNDGTLSEISLCLWDRNGNLAAENHTSPQNDTFDLRLLPVDTGELYPGDYTCRLSIATDSGISLAYQGKIVFSQTGIKAESLNAPQDLLVGEHWVPEGEIKASSSIMEVRLNILNESGKKLYTAANYPKESQIRLNSLSKQLKFEQLKQGNYRYQITASTKYGTEILADQEFHIWVENDPVSLTGFNLKEEYHPGDSRELNGSIHSEKSDLQDVGVMIRKLSEEDPMIEIHGKGKRSFSLHMLSERLHMNQLGCGRYLCTVTAVNDAGPVVLKEQVFSVLPDGLSLCNLEIPSVLSKGDSFSIAGVAASDDTPLKLISVAVTDHMGDVILDTAVSPGTPIFDLSEISQNLVFSVLEPGEYRLTIRGQNEHISELLCDSVFTVTAADDLIYWENEQFRTDRLSYPSGDSVRLGGVLASRYSFIEKVSAEVYGDNHTLMAYGEISPMDFRAELSELNNQLHLAPLSQGTYHLVISAKNEEACYTMLDDVFYISECNHSDGSVRKIYEPCCDRFGVICDSRCTACGAKILCGTVIEKEEHEFSDGCCAVCGKKESIVYSMQQTDEIHSGGCYVLGYRDGNDWYALDNNGKAQYISGPDENHSILATVDLIWFLQCSNGKINLFNSQGERLHIDSSCLTTARGTANGDLLFIKNNETFTVTGYDRMSSCISFADGEFKTGQEPAQFQIFELKSEKD